jgi:hypothetical protein
MENDDNTRECTTCSSTIDDGDELIINEHAYCTECAFMCYDCEAIMDMENHVTVGGTLFCTDCGSYCDRCEAGMDNDSSRTVDSDESWCEYCYENYSYYCESCSESYSGDCTYVQDTPYCERCYEDECYWCDDCDESYRNDDRCDCFSNDDSNGGRCCRGVRSSGTIHDLSLIHISEPTRQP